MALTLLGALLRLHDLGSASLWKDEIHQASAVRAPIGVFMGQLQEVENDMPLDYLAQHFVLRLAPETDFWVRFHSAIFAILTIPAAFLLLNALLGPAVGLVTATLLAVSPFHLHYSQEGRPYALLLLLTALSTWALWRFLRGERRPWLWGVLYLVTAVAGVWTHLAATLVIACQQLWVVTVAVAVLRGRMATRRDVLTRVGVSLTVALLAAVSIVPILNRVTGGEIGEAGIPFDPLTPGLLLEIFNGFTFARGDEVQWFPAGLIGAPLMVAGAVWALRRRPAAGWLLLCIGVGIPALMLLLCWHREHWFALRYVFPALVPLLGLMAMGVIATLEVIARWTVSNPAGRPLVVGSVLSTLCLAVAIVAAVFLWGHPAVKRDWRGAAEWVAANIGLEETLLISDNEWRRLSYYMDRHPWLGMLEVMDREDLLEIDPAEHAGKHVLLRSDSRYDDLRQRLEGEPTRAEFHRLSIVLIEEDGF